MPTLTCDRIEEAVRNYNSVQRFSDDYLTLRAALVAVQSLPWSLGRFVEVCLIADWGTISIWTFPFGDRIAMAQEIAAYWPQRLLSEASPVTGRESRANSGQGSLFHSASSTLKIGLPIQLPPCEMPTIFLAICSAPALQRFCFLLSVSETAFA